MAFLARLDLLGRNGLFGDTGEEVGIMLKRFTSVYLGVVELVMPEGRRYRCFIWVSGVR